MAGNQQFLDDDEISLYEIWDVLRRQRRIVVAVLVLSLLVTAGYALWRTPIYIMDAVIEIGQVPGLDGASLRPIASAEALVGRLNEVMIPRVQGRSEFGDVQASAEVLNTHARLVRLSTHVPAIAAATARAEWFLDEVIALLKAEHEGVWQQRNARLLQQIETLRASPRSTRQAPAPVPDPTQLESVRIAASPTQLVRAPTLAAAPEGQSATTLLLLGAVLGLMLGVFAAFGREFLVNAADPGRAT